MYVSPDKVQARGRRTATLRAVVVWMCAVICHSAAPGWHVLCADATECAAGHDTPAVIQPAEVASDVSILGHAAGHPHRGTTHDATTCPLCRSLQHSTVALPPLAAALPPPPSPHVADRGSAITPARNRAGGPCVPRAPPARA